MENIRVKNRIAKFGEYLMVNNGVAHVTAQGYCRCMSLVIRKTRKLTPLYPDIKDHILWMYKQKYSYSHIVNTSTAIEHYTKWKGYPVKLGRPQKPRRMIKNTLSEAEVSRLIVACGDNIRQKAIVAILAFSGIRNKELCGLKVEDADFGTNEIRITSGKNKRDRIVNISGPCTRVLVEYLKQYPHDAEGFLFRNLHNGGPVNQSIVRKILKQVGKKAGIEKRVFPHLLRHSLAVNLLKRGAKLLLVKDQLGHAFVETTMIYVTSNPLQNKSDYDYYTPAYI